MAATKSAILTIGLILALTLPSGVVGSTVPNPAVYSMPALFSKDGGANVTLAAEPFQVVCNLENFVLRADWFAGDARPTRLGDVRKVTFTMKATELDVPLGNSTRMLMWTQAPYSRQSDNATALKIPITSKPQATASPRIIRVDLEAAYFEGANVKDPRAKDLLTYTFVLACPTMPCPTGHTNSGSLGNWANECLRLDLAVVDTGWTSNANCTGHLSLDITHVSAASPGVSIGWGLFTVTPAVFDYEHSAYYYDYTCTLTYEFHATGYGSVFRTVTIEAAGAPNGAGFGTEPCQYTGLPGDMMCTAKFTKEPQTETFHGGGHVVNGTALPSSVNLCLKSAVKIVGHNRFTPAPVLESPPQTLEGNICAYPRITYSDPTANVTALAQSTLDSL